MRIIGYERRTSETIEKRENLQEQNNLKKKIKKKQKKRGRR